nr:unnamed protein product [Callosobruchus analis]
MSDQENWGEDDDNDPDYVPPVEIENGHVTSTTEDDSESSDKELEELANQISSDSEADDDIEVENVWDSDDSIADPDFIPDDNDVEEAFENELMNVWNETNATQTSRNETLTPKLGQAGLAAPCISGHVTPNEVAPDCVLVPETDSLLGKNGYVWTTKPKKEGKTPSINVVHVRPGPVPAVKGLVQPASSNRNVTMDNWFTSVPLVDRFAEKPFNLSIVGTIRKNKPQLPSQITENKKERQVGTSMFAYTNKSTVVSYKPKKNKIVNLISSMHNTVGSIKDDTKKPFIIETYNSTKGAVDTFDQMCQNMCANRKTRSSKLNGLFEYGVTMEIFEAQVRNNALHIKAKGRQRCKLLGELKNWGGQLKQVNVKIMAEPEISSPISNTQMYTLKRLRPYTSKNYCDIAKNYKYRRYHLCQYPIESWVYDKYEVSYYVKLLLEGLSNYVGEYIPNDPVMLSYWFAQNYLLLHEERLHLLQLNSALERLRMEYKFLKRVRTIRCSGCDMEISDPTKVFAMSKDGIQSNYVNPGGHNYETVTVTSAQNFQLEGKPSKQFSWFPGYAWTIMHCKNCGKHLGWRFTSSTSKPFCFYGLAKGGIKVDIEGGWHGTKLRLFTAIFEETRGTTFSRDYIPL